MLSLGFIASDTGALRIVDDFVLTLSVIIDSVSVFGYQNGSTTTSTFDTFRLQIWNGDPAAPGSTVVFGDTTTNRFSSASFTNIYRDAESMVATNQLPIMKITASGLSITLAPGTYWVDVQLGGTLAAGPFLPPITILGQTSPPGANARQWNGTAWNVLDDGQAGVQPQAVPFHITGTLVPCLSVATRSPLNQVVVAGASTGNVTVTVPSGCAWTAGSTVPWVTLTPPTSGSESGTVGYNVTANPGPNPRRGTLTIAGKTFIVSQRTPVPAPCTVQIPAGETVGNGAGGSSFLIDASTVSCAWSVKSHVGWITVTSAASGSGDSTVTYTFPTNPGGPRAGRITVNGKRYTVRQN